jgi:hypothetical protein
LIPSTYTTVWESAISRERIDLPLTWPRVYRRGVIFGANVTDTEYERRLKALQQEVSAAYLKGYEEARQRSQWTITAAVDESNRLRLALEEALVEVDETAKIKILAAMQRKA